MQINHRKVSSIALVLSLLAILFLQPIPIRAANGDCLAYENFTGSDGASLSTTDTTGPGDVSCPERTWTGSTWTILSNAAKNTPSLGSELLTNGTFDSDTGWTKGENWTISDGAAHHTTSTAIADLSSQNNPFLPGRWIRISYDLSSSTGGPVYVFSAVGRSSNGSWITTGRVIYAGNLTVRTFANASSYVGNIDNISLKQITLADLFASVPTGVTNVNAYANLTITPDTQSGVIVNMNSASTPTAGILAYCTTSTCYLEKFTGATTWTALTSGNISYAAGRTLRVETYTSGSDLKVKMYYNGSQVGTEQTISDASIISNTIHGVFSTYSGNSVDEFYVTDNTQEATATSTATNTYTATSTATSTQTETPTETPTGTISPTATFTETLTPTLTETVTATSTETFTPTVTGTPPTATATVMMPTQYWSSEITYGDIAVVGVNSILLLVFLLAFMYWLVTRDRRRA